MKIIMLAGSGLSTNYIYNGIKKSVNISHILVADSISSKKILKSRIKKLGLLHVVNQLLFQIFIVRLLRYSSTKIIKQREKELRLDGSEIMEKKVINVGSVNSDKCIKVIKSLKPDVIIVNGTSIINKQVLESTNALFINTHVGITPQYRGVHGGYWALRNRDNMNFGVTIHKVDPGIDTGDIIYQKTCEVNYSDNFSTYPLYQYALAIPLLIQAISDIQNTNLKTFKKEEVESKLYYHPTFTSYVWAYLKYGVK